MCSCCGQKSLKIPLVRWLALNTSVRDGFFVSLSRRFPARILKLLVRVNTAVEKQMHARLSCHQIVHVFAEVRNGRQVVVVHAL